MLLNGEYYAWRWPKLLERNGNDLSFTGISEGSLAGGLEENFGINQKHHILYTVQPRGTLGIEEYNALVSPAKNKYGHVMFHLLFSYTIPSDTTLLLWLMIVRQILES